MRASGDKKYHRDTETQRESGYEILTATPLPLGSGLSSSSDSQLFSVPLCLCGEDSATHNSPCPGLPVALPRLPKGHWRAFGAKSGRPTTRKPRLLSHRKVARSRRRFGRAASAARVPRGPCVSASNSSFRPRKPRTREIATVDLQAAAQIGEPRHRWIAP